jgi:hypothetical protein
MRQTHIFPPRSTRRNFIALVPLQEHWSLLVTPKTFVKRIDVERIDIEPLTRGNHEQKIELREKIPWRSQEHRGP